MCMGKVKEKIDEEKFHYLMNKEFHDVFLSVMKEFNQNCPVKITCFSYSDYLRYYFCNKDAYTKYCEKTIPILNRYLMRFFKEYYPKRYSWCRKKHTYRFFNRFDYELAYYLPIYMVEEFNHILNCSAY